MDISVDITKLIEELNLYNMTDKIDLKSLSIRSSEINRPSLQLSGFYDHFGESRIQIIGLAEYSYLESLDQDIMTQVLTKFFEHDFPCIVLCRSLKPHKLFIDLCVEHNVPLLSSEQSTTDFMGDLIAWLREVFAPKISMHGVLVDIYGEGVLIIGDSGIGKSETALELIRRGHRLVADDAVEIKKVSNDSLIGSCPDIIKYFIELRGIGIIDVLKMFGVESIKESQKIDLVIKLELWDENKDYDRIGMKDEYTNIIDTDIVCHYIPIRPGRNIAIICEAAAINYRQKKMGFNAAESLNQRLLNIN